MPKKYYLVYVGGRVDRPTIFSSWADTHPRVTGCKTKFQSFPNLEELYEFARAEGLEKKDLDHTPIKSKVENTSPPKGTKEFYAVASGRSVGVFDCYSGKTGSEYQVNEMSGACHELFKTRQQADAFIQDWKESVASTYKEAILKALDEGKRPPDMTFNVSALFEVRAVKKEATDDIASHMKAVKI